MSADEEIAGLRAQLAASQERERLAEKVVEAASRTHGNDTDIHTAHGRRCAICRALAAYRASQPPPRPDVGEGTTELSRAKELLREIATSGVEHEDERISYVTIQVDRETWIERLAEYRSVGSPPRFGLGSAVEALFPIGRAVRLAIAGVAAVLLIAGVAAAHPNCPPGCIESGAPTPVPTSVPTRTPGASPTVVGEKCPHGTPLYATNFSRIIPLGAKLIYCTRLNLPSPPSRLVWAFYDKSDQDCGNLKMTVQQLSGAKQTKSSGPMANGSVQFAKRIGQGEDPARVANGDYIVTLEGFQTHCTDYLLTFGAQP